MVDKRFIDDKGLSFKAKGLMVYLLSRPDGWKVYISHLATVSKDGDDSVRTAINELIEAGYVRREEVREKGRFVRYDYAILEIPLSPYAEKPDMVLSDTTKQELVMNDSNKLMKEVKNEEVRFPDNLNCGVFKEKWNEWISYRKERKLPKLTSATARKQIDMLSGFGLTRAIASIEASITNGWQGLFEPKMQPKQQSYSRPEHREMPTAN